MSRLIGALAWLVRRLGGPPLVGEDTQGPSEADWLTCEELPRLLLFPYSQVTERKLRLFACACCRRIWHLIPEEPCREMVKMGEEFADGLHDSWSLREAASRVYPILRQADRLRDRTYYARAAVIALYFRYTDHDYDALEVAAKVAEAVGEPGSRLFLEERTAQCDLLRDVLGNPFRHATLDPAWLAWREGLVREMARQMYAARDFSDMGILADALEDAGCTDEPLLSHCRGPFAHARGCWLVDRLLAREGVP